MRKRTTRAGSKTGPRKSGTVSLKINLCGKDGIPLSMAELRDGLIEAARELLNHDRDCRARTATLYVSMVNEDGEPVRINDANQLTIYPYRAAADEHGI